MLDLKEQVLPWIPGRQHQQVPIAPPKPLGGQPPEFAPEGGDIPVLHLLRQAAALEGQDEVVDPEDGLHVRGIGPEASGGSWPSSCLRTHTRTIARGSTIVTIFWEIQ